MQITWEFSIKKVSFTQENIMAVLTSKAREMVLAGVNGLTGVFMKENGKTISDMELENL